MQVTTWCWCFWIYHCCSQEYALFSIDPKENKTWLTLQFVLNRRFLHNSLLHSVLWSIVLIHDKRQAQHPIIQLLLSTATNFFHKRTVITLFARYTKRLQPWLSFHTRFCLYTKGPVLDGLKIIIEIISFL